MKYILIFILFIIYSCNDLNNIDVQGKYSIEDNGLGSFLKPLNAKDNRATIYPSITQYQYDGDFLVAEQIPGNPQNLKSIIGFDLYNYFKIYSQYLKDSNYYHMATQHMKSTITKDSILYNIFISKGASHQNTSKDISIRNEIADSILINDNYYKNIFSHDTNYWIIKFANDSLIGPLTKEELDITFNKLMISEKLRLN